MIIQILKIKFYMYGHIMGLHGFNLFMTDLSM